MSQAGAISGGGGGGGGNVVGPGSSTDRSIATWDGVTGTALFDNPTTNIDSTGRYRNSAQPCFFAFLSGGVNNVTGDGTTYTIPFDSVFFDNGSNFNTGTGQFVAPVEGKYMLTGTIYSGGYAASNTLASIRFVTSAGTYYMYNVNGFAMKGGGDLVLPFSVMLNMSPGWTAQIDFQVNGASKGVDLAGGGGTTSFGGYLLPC